MPRSVHNWNYRDVVTFLKEHGFTLQKPSNGSHERWIKKGVNGHSDIIAGVNITHGSYPVGTLKRIMRQSKIPQDEWKKWGTA